MTIKAIEAQTGRRNISRFPFDTSVQGDAGRPGFGRRCRRRRRDFTIRRGGRRAWFRYRRWSRRPLVPIEFVVGMDHGLAVDPPPDQRMAEPVPLTAAPAAQTLPHFPHKPCDKGGDVAAPPPEFDRPPPDAPGKRKHLEYRPERRPNRPLPPFNIIARVFRIFG